MHFKLTEFYMFNKIVTSTGKKELPFEEWKENNSEWKLCLDEGAGYYGRHWRGSLSLLPQVDIGDTTELC